MKRKRYAVVGVGSRSGMFINAMLGEHEEVAEVVGLCDCNATRMKFMHDRQVGKHNHPPIPMYPSAEFERMVHDRKVDCVIVTTMDRAHDAYICRAMELGCDVITEKPMTTDAEKCQRIIDTVKRTGRDLTVTFNYRYSPRNTKVKEIISAGEIGDVLSVHFEWLLDTKHGADYFRRWHRDKANSGGLMVHKATHHFDLVNWWLDSTPQRVFAMGRLGFYGRQNAETRGATTFYARATGSKSAQDDPFALHLDRDSDLKGMYLDAEHEDGYQRDQSVFGYNINIEDTMGVLVQYHNKAIMSYSLNAHCPWEGYRVMFNGTQGRLELNVQENTYVSGSKDDLNIPENHDKDEIIEQTVPHILLQKHWGKARAIAYEEAKGGHGGGDVRLLHHIFRGVQNDPMGHAAGYLDGALSILTGIAANRCFATGLPVDIDTLVRF